MADISVSAPKKPYRSISSFNTIMIRMTEICQWKKAGINLLEFLQIVRPPFVNEVGQPPLHAHVPVPHSLSHRRRPLASGRIDVSHRFEAVLLFRVVQISKLNKQESFVRGLKNKLVSNGWTYNKSKTCITVDTTIPIGAKLFKKFSSFRKCTSNFVVLNEPQHACLVAVITVRSIVLRFEDFHAIFNCARKTTRTTGSWPKIPGSKYATSAFQPIWTWKKNVTSSR